MITSTTQMPRKKGPPTALKIDTPIENLQIVLSPGGSSASTSAASSPTSETSPFHFRPATTKPRSLRNMKKLSLTLLVDNSSTNSLTTPPSAESQRTAHTTPDDSLQKQRPRRSSVASLPATSINPILHRKEEGGSPTIPYQDGPIQILPGIWLGSEDNARDWKGLLERGIKSILNVAKEVMSPFDSAAAQPLRPFASTPNLYQKAFGRQGGSDPTYYPAHLASGRPGMHYLKLEWSHGEADLVQAGFPAAMAFVDAALARKEGVLIHCQCGISRSATLVIALVMRAAVLCTSSVPPEVWELKGYQAAYAFVKQKSKWVGPNMSLIYHLLDYERVLKSGNASPTPSERSSMAVEEEQEWGRRRRMMDEAPSDADELDHDSAEIAREARALDKAMEDRIIARKGSASSIGSVGMGPAWRSRYTDRKRATSVTSNLTTSGSILSEDLVEEDEEEELLGIGGGFESCDRLSSGELESCSTSSESQIDDSPTTLQSTPFTPLTARPRECPPSARPFQTSFPASSSPTSTTRRSFNIPSQLPKIKRRPPPLGLLPSMPSSPPSQPPPPRIRADSRKLCVPPAHLHSPHRIPFPGAGLKQTPPALSTPSQTLFVFPPDSTPRARTPSTMTLTSNLNGPVPFPTLSTPRVSTFRSHGRTKSFIGLGVSPTPTTACSRVDAKGWIGL